jgi:glycosyltransferase involved in cell wall biosynthesis
VCSSDLEAARVVVTTETLADAYRELYPRHAGKFVAIRNAFDAVDLPPRAVPDRPARLVHFGHVYGGARTMAGVYEALAALRARGGFPRGGLVLENYGRLSDDDRARADRLGLGDVVRALDPVPYLEGLRRLRAAHLLLLPAWGTRRGPLFLPGKLYDYLLAGAPILALGANPELAGILERTRAGRLLAEDDVAGIAAALGEALGGGWRHEPDAAAVAEFSAERATGRLAALFDDVRREAGR